MFGLGFILGPVMGGLLGAIDLRLPFFAAGCAGAAQPAVRLVRAARVAAGRQAPAVLVAGGANPIASLRELARLGGVGLLVAVIACTALAQFVLYTSWVLYTTASSSAGARRRTAGRCSRSASCRRSCRACCSAGCCSASRPQRLAVARPGLLDARLPGLGRGDPGLDDVRGDLLQRARLHGRGIDPEHHLRRRRRRARQGQRDGRGRRAATA